MMKKLLFVCLVVLTLASCQKEEPLPEISDIKTSGITFVNGKARLTVGQSATFSVECVNVAISHYAWLVNDKIEGGEKEFVFTPAERGTFVIKVKIYNEDNSVKEQAVGEIQAVDPAPVVTCIHGDEYILSTASENSFSTAGDESMTISILSDDVIISRYEWKINGEAITAATSGTYEFARTWSGIHAFEVTLFNRDDIATTANFTINLNGTYKEGLIFYGTTNEDLAFYNTATATFNAGNLFNAVNGTNAGSGGLNDVYIYNNKIYLLTPSSPADRALITVADAQTYKVIKTIGADGFNTAALGEIYNLMVVNENKFYIGHNKSGSGNISGIGVLTVNADGSASYKVADMAGTSGQLGVAGPTWARMFRHGKYVLAACGNNIQIIDTDTDQVSNTIAFDTDRQVCDILKGRDGKIYAFVSGEEDKSSSMWLWGMGEGTTSPALVAVIDPASLTKVSETELKVSDTKVDIKNALSGCYAVASLTSDELFFVQKGEYWTASSVYKYNYTTKETSLFAALTSQQAENGISGYLAADKNGVLYIPTTNYTTSSVKTYNISTAATTSSPVTSRINGDAGIIATYRFE